MIGSGDHRLTSAKLPMSSLNLSVTDGPAHILRDLMNCRAAMAHSVYVAHQRWERSFDVEQLTPHADVSYVRWQMNEMGEAVEGPA